jgi:hypothetical protein
MKSDDAGEFYQSKPKSVIRMVVILLILVGAPSMELAEKHRENQNLSEYSLS